ncbi:hypothetical protein [Mesomycoplasma ovipneumoniae]|uniref:hypothetical protein n=1 Tax=Mesomycoplasma ovipneumoniae TaxID=29562 RepID=UPI0028A60881|nr:hypothetical protein [Mesomycoplasma ovipneumoniae]WNM15381.1 hypothetical protein RNM01_02000 [Mesomycoplasma ovipneumoniae]
MLAFSLNSNKKSQHVSVNFSCPSLNAGFLINATPSRIRMVEKVEKIDESKNFIIRTLTTKQDRNPNTGIIKLENNLEKKLNYRFISNREAFRLMGFENSDFEKLEPLISKNILTKESLYRQARKFYYSNNFRSANKFNL